MTEAEIIFLLFQFIGLILLVISINIRAKTRNRFLFSLAAYTYNLIVGCAALFLNKNAFTICDLIAILLITVLTLYFILIVEKYRAGKNKSGTN
ncbi:hypothetical protein [Ruminiclostridium papyrosolvens]|uniref:Uncharacterized protein n=1 Tax=Ruminiclostridium papyrosolvens C7 TaxID=1330534 RepID=U4R367_9FIRM|nr:hypothetical protein [Ruminiclostridium papyrosolvens]EPR12049.1 hypothetical protein L323_09870 [Ruminiclostridium papyrosolvens C7]